MSTPPFYLFDHLFPMTLSHTFGAFSRHLDDHARSVDYVAIAFPSLYCRVALSVQKSMLRAIKAIAIPQYGAVIPARVVVVAIGGRNSHL
jgi:hypothetical protein